MAWRRYQTDDRYTAALDQLERLNFAVFLRKAPAGWALRWERGDANWQTTGTTPGDAGARALCWLAAIRREDRDPTRFAVRLAKGAKQ